MWDSIYMFITVYFIGISMWSIGLTLYDKRAARRGFWRVKERTLVLVSVMGGSIAMLVVMRIIRHKTRHKKFMMCIPVIIILQIAIAILLLKKS